jgi:hypothetical protein
MYTSEGETNRPLLTEARRRARVDGLTTSRRLLKSAFEATTSPPLTASEVMEPDRERLQWSTIVVPLRSYA